jgi:BirA family biotin operon repressor/biotin-[acetyl-CoA-carboxylase] ligase
MPLIAALKRLAAVESEPLHSLARALAVSPAVLCRELQQALDQGVPIAIRGDRYRLHHSLDWLDAERIGARIGGAGLNIQILEECGSTNAELLRAARAGAAQGRVVAAELQTQGRGRLGRSWQAGVCSGLCFSLLWRFDQPASGLSGLSLAVGVAVVRALRQHAVQAVLKWPNDVQWRERKLGGILIEAHADSDRSCAAVIGIGINVRLSACERSRIDQPVADLAEAGCGSIARGDLLAAILLQLAEVLPAFARTGFAGIHSEWDRYHGHAGREVELRLPSGARLEGRAVGVDATGRLLLADGQNVRAVSAADVSLRVRG